MNSRDSPPLVYSPQRLASPLRGQRSGGKSSERNASIRSNEFDSPHSSMIVPPSERVLSRPGSPPQNHHHIRQGSNPRNASPTSRRPLSGLSSPTSDSLLSADSLVPPFAVTHDRRHGSSPTRGSREKESLSMAHSPYGSPSKDDVSPSTSRNRVAENPPSETLMTRSVVKEVALASGSYEFLLSLTFLCIVSLFIFSYDRYNYFYFFFR